MAKIKITGKPCIPGLSYEYSEKIVRRRQQREAYFKIITKQIAKFIFG